MKPADSSSLPMQYVVIVNGASEKHHLVNVERAVESFRLRNPNTKILVISPQPPAAKADHFISTEEFSSQGYKKLDQTLKGWRRSEKDQVVTDSQVTLYTTGHGGIKDSQACVDIQNNDGFCLPISDLLKKIVTPLKVNHLALIADGCKSGVLVRSVKEFRDKLNRELKVEVITAGADEENVYCQDFAPYFFSKEVKDINKDGLISYQEAFQYTLEHSPNASLAHYLGFGELSFNGVKSQAAFSSNTKLKIANNAQELDQLIVKEPGKFNLVMFTTDWCNACHQYRPIFAELAQQYGDRVNFIMALKQYSNYENTPGDWSKYPTPSYPTVAFVNHRGELTKVDNIFKPFDSFYEAAFIDKKEIATYYERALDAKNSPQALIKMIQQLDNLQYDKAIPYAPLIVKLIEHPNIKVRDHACKLYADLMGYEYLKSGSFVEESKFLESKLPYMRMAGLYFCYYRAEKMSLKAEPAKDKKDEEDQESRDYKEKAHQAIRQISKYLEDDNREVRIIAASFLRRCEQLYVGLPTEIKQKVAPYIQDKRKLAVAALKINFISVQKETLVGLKNDLETAQKLLPQIIKFSHHPDHSLHSSSIDLIIHLLPELPNLEKVLRNTLNNSGLSAAEKIFIAKSLEGAGKAFKWNVFLQHDTIETRYETLRYLSNSKRYEFDLEKHWDQIFTDPELKTHPRINPYVDLKSLVKQGILLDYAYEKFLSLKQSETSIYNVQALGVLPLIKLKLGKPLTLEDLKEFSKSRNNFLEEFGSQLVQIVVEDSDKEKQKLAFDILHRENFTVPTLEAFIAEKSSSLAAKLFYVDLIGDEFSNKENFNQELFIKEHNKIKDYVEKQFFSSHSLTRVAAIHIIATRFIVDKDYAQEIIQSLIGNRLNLKQKILYIETIGNYLSEAKKQALYLKIKAPLEEWIPLLESDNIQQTYIALSILDSQAYEGSLDFSKKEKKILASILWKLSQNESSSIKPFAISILANLDGQKRLVERDLKKRILQLDKAQSTPKPNANPSDSTTEKSQKSLEKTRHLYQSTLGFLKKERSQLDGNSFGFGFAYELTGLKNFQSSHFGFGFNFMHRKGQWAVNSNFVFQAEGKSNSNWHLMGLSVGGRYFLRRYPKVLNPYLMLPELGMGIGFSKSNPLISGKLGLTGLGFSVNWKLLDIGLNTMLGMRFDKQRIHLINSFLLNASLRF